MDHESWSVAVTASGMAEAQVMAGRLEVEGVPVRLRYDVAGSLYGITVNGLGAVKILVPEEYVEQARAILGRSYEEPDLDWQEDGQE
jgi:hypothetical protein